MSVDPKGLEAAVREFMPLAQVAFLWTRKTPPEDEIQRYRDAYNNVLLALAATSPAGDRPLTPCHSEGGCIRAYEDDTCGEQGQCSIVLALEAQALRYQSTGVTEISDEMVERAMKEFALVGHNLSSQEYDEDIAFAEALPSRRARLQKSRDAMRAALRAALSAGGRT